MGATRYPLPLRLYEPLPVALKPTITASVALVPPLWLNAPLPEKPRYSGEATRYPLPLRLYVPLPLPTALGPTYKKLAEFVPPLWLNVGCRQRRSTRWEKQGIRCR